MSVSGMHPIRAIDIPVSRELPKRLIRQLATSYWRRSNSVVQHGYSLEALAIFDESIAQSLAGIKTHLLHAPNLFAEMADEANVMASDLASIHVATYVHTTLEVLRLQVDKGKTISPRIWSEMLHTSPLAACDALQFCFDKTLAEYLSPGLNNALKANDRQLVSLVLKLGIARPGVSEDFTHTLSSIFPSMDGGFAQLCQWRCTNQLDEGKALQAVQQNNEADAALIALACGGSNRALSSAVYCINNHIAVLPAIAILSGLARDRLPAMLTKELANEDITIRLMSAALLGSIKTFVGHVKDLDWNDKLTARLIKDCLALLSGREVSVVSEMTKSVTERQEAVAQILQQLPQDEAGIRFGHTFGHCAIEQYASLLGGPLRQLVYLEYLAQKRGMIWLDATDLAPAQRLALSFCSMLGNIRQ